MRLLMATCFFGLGVSAVGLACVTTTSSTDTMDAGDATAGDSAPNGDATADSAPDGAASSDARQDGDSDAAFSCSALDPLADACISPCVVAYVDPGCGDAAHPICRGGVEDACARTACTCSGQPIVGCDYFTAPWGPCDGGTD